MSAKLLAMGPEQEKFTKFLVKFELFSLEFGNPPKEDFTQLSPGKPKGKRLIGAVLIARREDDSCCGRGPGALILAKSVFPQRGRELGWRHLKALSRCDVCVTLCLHCLAMAVFLFLFFLQDVYQERNLQAACAELVSPEGPSDAGACSMSRRWSL